MCFGSGEMGVRPDGVILLERSWSDEALAARVAHLRLHEPLQLGPHCLERAIEQEATARMAEIEVRQALEVESPPLAWGHLRGQATLSAWLRENSDPAVDGYRLRCKNAKSSLGVE